MLQEGNRWRRPVSYKSMTKGALNRRNGKGRLILLESSKPSRQTVKATPDETAPDAAANLAAL